jgi:hypothetical protein
MKKSSRRPLSLSVNQLLEEHRALENKLDLLNHRHYLTPAEQIERKTIKKLKLLKKDQIAILTRSANA